MKKQRHLLSNLWESYPEAIATQYTIPNHISIGEYLAEMLEMGPFYYYVINIADNSLYHVHENLCNIHGTTVYPTTLQQVIDYIHPGDLDFVVEAEKSTILKMQEIGLGSGLLFKNSFCFRMKVADGSYHLFHHQAFHLAKDEQGRITTALNIHTDINHITHVNNKIVLVGVIGGRKDYYQIDLSQNTPDSMPLKLSRREMEILHLLAQGLSSQQIADKLFISQLTVRVHRKNLLKKTKTSSSASLIKKCIEFGLV